MQKPQYAQECNIKTLLWDDKHGILSITDYFIFLIFHDPIRFYFIGIFVVASSVYGKEWGAHQAIDGKFSKYGFGYFHSAVEPYPWLMIRLNQGIILSGITIHNRQDCCGDRLKAIEIRAGEELIDEDHSGPIQENTKCGKFDGPGETGGVHTIICDRPIAARIVTIQIKRPGDQVLNLDEIELL